MFKLIIAYGFLIKNMKNKNIIVSSKKIVNDDNYRKDIIKEAQKIQNNKEITWALQAIEDFEKNN